MTWPDPLQVQQLALQRDTAVSALGEHKAQLDLRTRQLRQVRTDAREQRESCAVPTTGGSDLQALQEDLAQAEVVQRDLTAGRDKAVLLSEHWERKHSRAVARNKELEVARDAARDELRRSRDSCPRDCAKGASKAAKEAKRLAQEHKRLVEDNERMAKAERRLTRRAERANENVEVLTREVDRLKKKVKHLRRPLLEQGWDMASIKQRMADMLGDHHDLRERLRQCWT